MTRAYDGFGRMDSETQDGSLTLTYLHDESGAVKEITYPTGSVIVGMRYTLDDMSRPTTIERKLSTAVEGVSTSAWETTATVKYLGHREVERLQSPYDLKRTQSYTSFREPEDLEYKKNSTGALKTGLHSIWDADGRMTVRERMHDESGGYEWGEVFRYDEMGRLTKMWYDVRNPNSFASNDPVSGTNPFDHSVDWTLGKVYERDAVVKTTYGGAVTTTNYTDNLHYQVTAGPATMAWNDNGHLTDRGSDDFAWTALGQLRQAAISGETARDYTYDAFGRRVKTVAGSQTNRFLYHGWHMIGEYDSTAGHWLWQEGPWCEGERMLEHVARDTNDLDTDSNVTEYRTYAVHEDFQDTVWGLSDTGAAMIERYFYTDPYGASETKNAAGTNIGAFATNVFHRKRLHGGFIEAVSGLFDYRRRWYCSRAGSWISRDPIGAIESVNLFQFVLSSPVNRIDHGGLKSSNCTVTVRKTIWVDWNWVLEDGVEGRPPASQRAATVPQAGTYIPLQNWVLWTWVALHSYFVQQRCGCCEVDLSQMKMYMCTADSCPAGAGDLVLHPKSDGSPTSSGNSGVTGRSGQNSTLPYDTVSWDADGHHPGGDESILAGSEATLAHEFMHVIGRGGHEGLPGQPQDGEAPDESDLCGLITFYHGSNDQCKEPGGSCCPRDTRPKPAITPGSGNYRNSALMND